MYRNCVYLPREGCVRLWTWDEQGNRITVDHTFEPYLYVECDTDSDATSIFNTPLRKKVFHTQYERYKYAQNSGNKRLFENLPVTQQFLIDRYWKENKKSDFNRFPIRVVFLDIEYYVEGAFSQPTNPVQPVNVITVYDSLSKQFTTWGTGGEYKKTRDNVNYVACVSEKDMLQKFLGYLEKDHPDVLSGWNSENFDIPYLINRIARLFGEEEVKRFSPTGNVYSREYMGNFGKMQTRWYIEGVSCLDYLEVYKTFSPGEKSSFKLNDIAEAEIGEKKIDYGTIDLGKLADTDWQTFVDYNIQDVNLLVRLDEKLQFIALARKLAYVGLTHFEAALGTLLTITGAAVIQARQFGLVVPTFEIDEHKKNPGAFVAEPLPGFHDYVVSFDVNSLYPNTLITLNLSPETKIGRIEEENENEVVIKHVSGKTYKLTPEAFKGFIQKEQIAVTRANCLFSQKKKGIFPIIVDNLYEERVQIKKELKEVKKKLYELGENHPDYAAWKDKGDKLDVSQFTVKILINRLYGAFGNKHFAMQDSDIASSITLTGQAVIKESSRLLTEWINKEAKLKGTVKEVKRVVYNDTDSCYMSLAPYVEAKGLKFVENGKATKLFLDTAQELEDYLNAAIKKWGATALNSTDCRFQFKREAVCDRALFLVKKKRYILHILDLEGVPCNKFKYVGVDVVRTTMPKPIKPMAKELVELMIKTKDAAQVNKLLNQIYEKFKTLPIIEVATVTNINRYEEAAARCNEFHMAKGMAYHVKGAYVYNKLLERMNLVGKYEKIGSGDKIRLFYVKTPNKYGVKACAFKYYYPEEFNSEFEVDYELMFEKLIYGMLERLYEACGWTLFKPGAQPVTDLFSFLGE